MEIHASIQEKTILVKFSMLHRHLIFSFVFWYNRQELFKEKIRTHLHLLIADDLYLCIELFSKYEHHLLIAE